MKKIWLVIAVVTLVGCHQISHGVIVEKKTEPAHTETVMMPMMIGETMVLMPQTYFYAEGYAFQVEGVTKEGKQIVEKFYVEKGDYDAAKVGDRFSCGGNTDCVREAPKR